MGSTEIVIVVNIALGAILLFFGARFLRLTIGAYGALIGLTLSAAIMAGSTIPDGFQLLIAFVAALIVGMLAVRFYKFLVRASISFFVFNLSYALLLQLQPDTFIAAVSGVAIAVLAFFLIKALKIIDKLFVGITSLQGSATLLASISMIVTKQTTDALRHGDISALLRESWVWAVAWLAVAVVGMLVQSRVLQSSRRSRKTLEDLNA